MSGEVPAFPPLSGTEQFPAVLTNRIAAVAWEKANGDTAIFQRLCAQHVRGDIDLFADRPAETDATERVRAAEMQREIESAVLQPAGVETRQVVSAAAVPAGGPMSTRRPEPASIADRHE